MIDFSVLEEFLTGCLDAENGVPHKDGNRIDYDRGYAYGYASQQAEELTYA